MSRRLVSVILLIAGFSGLFIIGEAATWSGGRDSPTPFKKRSSSAIALTEDNSELLVVNPDSNSITLIDLAVPANIIEIAVGADPRTVTVDEKRNYAYVANRASNSVSVVDLTALELMEVPVGHQPYGVVVSPGDGRLYIAEQGSDQVRILDTQTWKRISLIQTTDRPSGLALSADGRTLYVTHLLTNTITVLDTSYPYATYLPLVQSQQLAGKEAAPTDNRPALTHLPSGATISLWPDSNLVQSFIISPDERFAYVPHTRSNSSNRALTFDTTVFPLVSLIDLSAQEHLVGQQIDLGTLDPPGVGLPFDAALTPDGAQLWVLNAASNDITVIDLAARERVAHIEVGDNPRGIVISAAGDRAYVNNSLAGTVSVIDTAVYSVTNRISTTTIPLPPLLLEGKRLFHSSDDPRLSAAQWIACSTCHFDGEHDGRTWSFGFSGPRNTTSLLGMIQTYPLRWSGEWNESADSEFAIRKENFGSGLIAGEMHCALFPPDCVDQPPNQGRDGELDGLAAFMDALPMPLSPAHTHGEPLAPGEKRGQLHFDDPALACAACHPAPLYTDLQKHDVGTATADEKIGPEYDTPSLRGLHNSAPFFHDGSATTLYEAITRPSPGGEHDVSSLLDEAEIQDLILYLHVLPFD